MVGWGLTHDDGGLRILYVLETARRKRYGLSIVISPVEEVRRTRKIPFTYIENDNSMSRNPVTIFGSSSTRTATGCRLGEYSVVDHRASMGLIRQGLPLYRGQQERLNRIGPRARSRTLRMRRETTSSRKTVPLRAYSTAYHVL
ncbi:MAG: hypothetical protein JSV89_19400 [Spirochaetaceae bacterium]|nr:MAG: hypothetical protein JSV89_19400 [Spirochaetaceae bacterium]